MGRVAEAQKRTAENLRRVPESQPVRIVRPEAADLSDEPFPDEFPASAPTVPSVAPVSRAPIAEPDRRAPVAEPERPRPTPVEARLAPVVRPAWSEPGTRPYSRDASRGAASQTDVRSMFENIDEALRQEPPFRRRP